MQLQPGALEGLQIVDLTTVIMGPFATATLSDLGADVIKVEPLGGDMSRDVGARRHDGMSALSLNLQRNKRSIAVNLASEEGRNVLTDLVARSDVVVTNLRPRSREKLGITYEQLRECNPDLIFCSAQAYGASTALRDSPAYDDIVQAASGTARLAELIPGGQPSFAPYVIADKVAGLYIAIAILAAVVERSRSGTGQAVDVPMVDVMMGFNLVEHLAGHTFDPPEGDFGWSRILVPERAPHRSADGWVCIMPYSTQNWNDFFVLAGRAELVDDPRFITVDARHRRMGELLRIVEVAAATKGTDEWLRLCRDRGIPASNVVDLAQIRHDPYALDQGLIVRRDHPTEGSYYALRTPLSLSRTPVIFRRHAPVLGGDTDEVLMALGYPQHRIDALEAAGVVKRVDAMPTAAPESSRR